MKIKRPNELQATAIRELAETMPGVSTLIAPTGGGKSSVLAPELVKSFLRQNQRVLSLTPGPHTAVSFASNLLRSGVSDIHVMVAGFPQNSASMRCTVASVWTIHALARRAAKEATSFYLKGFETRALDVLERIAPDVCFWDEIQKLTGRVSTDIRGRFPEANHVSLTATPYLGRKGISDAILGRIIMAGTPALMVERGMIAPVVVKCPAPAEPLKLIRKHARGRCGFVFCHSIARSIEVGSDLSAGGIRSAVVTKNTRIEERQRHFASLDAGRLDVVVGVGCFVEALDLARPSFVLFDSAPSSRTKWFQAIGRARRLRKSQGPGKVALVLDPHRAVLKLGLPNDATTNLTPHDILICAKCLYANRNGCTSCSLQDDSDEAISSLATTAQESADATTGEFTNVSLS